MPDFIYGARGVVKMASRLPLEFCMHYAMVTAPMSCLSLFEQLEGLHKKHGDAVDCPEVRDKRLDVYGSLEPLVSCCVSSRLEILAADDPAAALLYSFWHDLHLYARDKCTRIGVGWRWQIQITPANDWLVGFNLYTKCQEKSQFRFPVMPLLEARQQLESLEALEILAKLP